MASDRPSKVEVDIIDLLESIDRRLGNIEKYLKPEKPVIVETRTHWTDGLREVE